MPFGLGSSHPRFSGIMEADGIVFTVIISQQYD